MSQYNFEKFWKSLFTLKTISIYDLNLIIPKASIYLSKDLILFKFIFKDFFLFLLKEFY